jgi:two-component system nitrogen regulation sensor histidine kinase NtrY
MPDRSDSSPARAPASEARRRRREGWVILATAIAVVLFTVFETRLPQSAGSTSLGTDAVLVALINLNLILLVLLVFLVGRNVVKLFLDRRRRILGSHLRTRLVTAFVAIALVPTTMLVFVAWVFVGNSVEKWFNGQVESALQGSLDVAHAYYEDLGSTSLGFARQLGERLAADGLLRPDRREALKRFLDERRADYQIDLIEVFAEGQALARSRRPDLPGRIGIEPWSELVRRAVGGGEGTAVDAAGEADMIRAAAPVLVNGSPVAAVVVDSYVPNSVVKRREDIDRSFGEYLRLKIQRRPIQTTYTITLLLVTLVVLFSATWAGFYVARGITVPIQRLAEGTRAVAQGDLDYRIEGEGDDEIGTLVTAFNRMTADLKTNGAELEARRRYLEIVLGNITAGVISTDGEGRITTMNEAAAALLGVDATRCVGHRLDAVCASETFAEIRQLAADLLADVPAPSGYPIMVGNGVRRADPLGRHAPPVERQVKIAREDHEVAVLLTGTSLVDEADNPRGIVLFLEDVTHLLRVQRMEAWREVARRIAHEIKNPLTPIQLSAQRLRRRYTAQLRDGGAVFDECTRTIIQQVDELKALVNEFSTFARMPAGAHTPQDLNRLVDETLVLFREGHRDIDFEFTPEAELPVLELDREGIKRAVINLLDNAVAACAARRDPGLAERRRVELRTGYDRAFGIVRLEIADNGGGMTPEVKARLFEPYFSTKSDGTGLGLAIVSSIVADHSGFIRVRDNVPRGSRFILEFPVRRQAAQLAAQARLGAYAARGA